MPPARHGHDGNLMRQHRPAPSELMEDSMNAKMIVSLEGVIARWYTKEVVEGNIEPSPLIGSRTFEMMATAAAAVLEALQDYQDENETKD